MSFRYITLGLLALFLVHCSNPKSSGTQRQDVSIYDVWSSFLQDNDGDGYYSKVQLTFDVDVSAGEISIDAYIGLRMTGSSGTYTAYGFINGITITGDSEADTAVFTIGAPYDELAFGRYDILIQIFPTDDAEAEALAEVSSATSGYSFLGNVGFEPAAEDVPFEITFTNPVFTPIDITVFGVGTATVQPSSSYTFNLQSNPGTFSYSAETSGKDASGGQIGLEITWDFTHNVSGQSSASYTLVIPSSFFFITMRNTTQTNWSPIYVNFGNSTYQSQDDIIIPADGVLYNTGYYYAFNGTEVRAYLQGQESWWQWVEGVNFILPFTDNQSVSLTNAVAKKQLVDNNRIEISPSEITKPELARQAKPIEIELPETSDAQIDYGKAAVK